MSGVVLVTVATTLVARSREGKQDTPAAPAYEETATVQRRDLVETMSFDGTLGYSDVNSLVASGQGTLTYAAVEGSRVKRGETLYSIDNAPVRLLYGTTPMYRDLSSSASDGQDVRQLEANLVALGYDPDDDVSVDREWDSATTAAVKRWEDDLAIAEDGIITRGEVVFLPGVRVVGDHAIEKGAPVAPGAQLFTTSSAKPEVSLDVEVADSYRFEPGDRVTIELPNGKEVRGRVASVGKIATPGPEDSSADPTIAVAVSLSSGARTGGIDQAPIDVIVETDRAKGVLAVPVSALLATSDGFALEIVEGSGTRMTEVEPGSHADGWVEIQGSGIAEGTEVVVAP